jgi:hypothetical protein
MITIGTLHASDVTRRAALGARAGDPTVPVSCSRTRRLRAARPMSRDSRQRTIAFWRRPDASSAALNE